MTYGQNSFETKIENKIVNHSTPLVKINQLSLTKSEVILLAQWCQIIENHYGKPMDIEWAKDGQTDQLFIVQARPETVHAKLKRILKNIYSRRKK